MMDESQRNNFMMKYGSMKHVHQFIDNMAKGGEHYDIDAAYAGLDRVRREAEASGGFKMSAKGPASALHKELIGKVFDAVHAHGSAYELTGLLESHPDCLHTSQLEKAWHVPHAATYHGSDHTVSDNVRHAILDHVNVPASILRDAMKSEKWSLRHGACKHPNASVDVLKMGVADSHPEVREQARKTAKARRIKLT